MKGNRQAKHCAGAGIMREPTGQIVVEAGSEQGKRSFQVIPRLAIFAGEPTRHPGGPVSDARLGGIWACFDVAEESRCVLPHRWQVATHIAADP